jgi:outer membrane protein assembly factor BamB
VVTDGGQVFIQSDNEEKSFIAAVDAETGHENWRVDRDEQTNWSTPFLWKTPGRMELVTAGKNKARSYDPATGKLLWELGGMSSIVVPTPIASESFCFVSSGYVMDAQHRPIFAVKPGATGDLTLTKEQSSSDSVAWYQRLGGAYMPTPVLVDGQVYVLYDRGLFGAFDAKTGEVVYSKKRLPKGGNFTASPWAYRGHIFCLAEDGQTHVIKAGPEFEVALVNPPLDEKFFMATPAIVGDTLLIRGSSKLYAIRDAAAGK